ncbi:MAG TPA: neutral/alkaline non-lysosomal ceramidase N-terminal domain-containing protein [Methylomirabilota bacterium]|nr:neutral/alkaline non-lysosomal ceramidase N-terminal domain-containing protein [Methylomirabilota bacterium]
MEVALPSGTPLAGYGSLPRRAWLPDLLGRRAHAFWFRPAAGVHDPLRVRALLLQSGSTRLLWLAADLVGIDGRLLPDLAGRLERHGMRPSAVIAAASHTHSGPGAFADSAVLGPIAVDRLSPAVRVAILDAFERAALEAGGRMGPAAAGSAAIVVPGIARSRIGAPLDEELGLLKVVDPQGRPRALVWNYAVHGTALSRDNLLLSGDLMAEAGARLERELGAPALFVNGAEADVSPRGRGWDGVRETGQTLARAAMGAWGGIAAEPRPALDVAIVRSPLPQPAVSVRSCLGRWVPEGMRLGLSATFPASIEVLAVRVGRSAWVVIPGELETRLGREIKTARAAGLRHVFVIGVANGYLGYLLTPEVSRRPSYIACASVYGPRGGEIVRDAALDALKRLTARGERR